MPKNNVPRQNVKTNNDPMSKNQFVFKLTPPPRNLDNDPSVMRYQFHFKVGKDKNLGDAEPVYKSKKRSSQSTMPTIIQSTYTTSSVYSPASEVTPSLYNNANSPLFFTTPPSTNRTLSPQTSALNTSFTRNTKPPIVSSIKAEKIKMSNLVNDEMVDEKKLDVLTINTLAETFQVPAKTLETDLTIAKRW